MRYFEGTMGEFHCRVLTEYVVLQERNGRFQPNILEHNFTNKIKKDDEKCKNRLALSNNNVNYKILKQNH